MASEWRRLTLYIQDVMTESENIRVTLSRAYLYANAVSRGSLLLMPLVTVRADVFKLCCNAVAKVELCVSIEA